MTKTTMAKNSHCRYVFCFVLGSVFSHLLIHVKVANVGTTCQGKENEFAEVRGETEVIAESEVYE